MWFMVCFLCLCVCVCVYMTVSLPNAKFKSKRTMVSRTGQVSTTLIHLIQTLTRNRLWGIGSGNTNPMPSLGSRWTTCLGARWPWRPTTPLRSCQCSGFIKIEFLATFIFDLLYNSIYFELLNFNKNYIQSKLCATTVLGTQK